MIVTFEGCDNNQVSGEEDIVDSSSSNMIMNLSLAKFLDRDLPCRNLWGRTVIWV